jgi:hypothetical protein
VSDRYTAHEGSDAACQGGCGVALHQHQIGFDVGHRFIERGDGARQQAVEGLIRAHDGEIAVRRYAKQLQHRIEHFAVLRCYAHDRFHDV